MKADFHAEATATPCRSVYRIAAVGVPFLLMLFATQACTASPTPRGIFGEDCLEQQLKRLESLPEKQVITTLDDQLINLEEFNQSSLLIKPGCALPYKFYHWPWEIKKVYSQGLHRKIKHKIRIYYNLSSTCYPENREEDQTYGDVAEFYDEFEMFMGFAVYLGKGMYCPLPHAGYTGPASLEAAKIDWRISNQKYFKANERKEG